MDKSNILLLLSLILQTDIKLDLDGRYYVSEKVYSPLGSSEFYYKEGETQGTIRIENHGRNNDSEPTYMSFREYIWNRLNLENIQMIYDLKYKEWKKWNKSVDYIPVQIIRDINDCHIKSDDFSYLFCQHRWEKESNDGLSLLVAEAGMGKSSFCLNLCKLVASHKGWGRERTGLNALSFKEAFCNEAVSFPILFYLNDCRNDDLDEYIQNRLFGDYNLALTFKAYQYLCSAGIFCTVLDAWDQMHHTPFLAQVEKSFGYINKLCSKQGRVLITCRRSFYQKHLRHRNSRQQEEVSEAVHNAKLFVLGRFDKETVWDYYCGANTKFEEEWIKDGWNQNSDLLEKPLNMRLLAGCFETIMKKYDLRKTKVRTFNFLEAIFQKWIEETGYLQNTQPELNPLKLLVFLTLSSGLNRGIDIDYFKKKIANEAKTEQILANFEKLEFLSVQKDRNVIEFRLAVFQEFLWTHFVLEELSEKKLLGKDALLNSYMLTLEVRTWVAEELQKIENDWLYIQLKGDGRKFLGLKYKDKAEIGYCASNVLTLYRDLNKVKHYHKQFLKLKTDLKHYCFEEADLRGMDLSEAKFDYSNLARADLSYTDLRNTSFLGADLYETTWNEYGHFTNCVFVENSVDKKNTLSEEIKLVAGTESGSLLIYNILTRDFQIINLDDSKIKTIAADTEGIYTATEEGWIGFIDSTSGELKNEYSSANRIETIVSAGRASAYFGTEGDGLFRYNWKTGVKQTISIDAHIENIANINYYKVSDSERYIACIAGRSRKEIYILKPVKSNQVAVVVHAKLTKADWFFDDICFAENELVMAVARKGIYSMTMSDLLGMAELDNLDICNNANCRYEYSGSAVSAILDWAEAARQLFILEKDPKGLNSVICIPWEGSKKSEQWDLEWGYKDSNYAFSSKSVAFCVSSDASYLAVSWERLAIFEKQEDYYFSLIKEPIEASVNMLGANFDYIKGLEKAQEEAFKKRSVNEKK